MDVVGVVIKENNANGIPAAEEAIREYLRTRVGEKDLLEGLDAVEAEIGNVEDVMRRESNVAETLRCFLDGQRYAVSTQ